MLPANVSYSADLSESLTEYLSLPLQIVGTEDVGKIYSVLAFTQSLLPLAGVPFFGFLYRATVESFPGTFSLVTAAFAVVELGLILTSRWVNGRSRKAAREAAINER